MMNENRERKQEGQSIVLVAVALIALVIFAAIAVDVSNTYVHRRTAQNAADAAALAGARDLGRQLNACSLNPSCDMDTNFWMYSTETTIQAAMNDYAERNGIEDTDGVPANTVNTNVTGFYLDESGDIIQDPNGNPIVIGALDIVQPDARGVEATADSLAPSFFGGVIGLDGIPVSAESAVVFEGVCTAPCIVPIATYTYSFEFDHCYNIWNGEGSGNFGWLNWSWQNEPACEQGGSTCSSGCVADNLVDPCRSGMISVGDWLAGTVGDNNSNAIRAALRDYIDTQTPFTVPIYDRVGCPWNSPPCDQGDPGCTCAACGGGDPGNGQGWGYRVVGFAKFLPIAYQLAQGGGNAYPQGFDPSICDTVGEPPHGGNRISGYFLGFVEGEGGNCGSYGTIIAPSVIR